MSWRCTLCYGGVLFVRVGYCVVGRCYGGVLYVMVVYCVVGLRIVCYGGVLYVMVVYCMLCTVHYGGVLCGRAV